MPVLLCTVSTGVSGCPEFQIFERLTKGPSHLHPSRHPSLQNEPNKRNHNAILFVYFLTFCGISDNSDKSNAFIKLPFISKVNRSNVGKVFGGMSLQKRKESATLMKEWSRLMAHAPFLNRDQGKLTESIQATEPNVCWLPSHWWHPHNQADQMDRIWFKLVGEATFLLLPRRRKEHGKRC